MRAFKDASFGLLFGALFGMGTVIMYGMLGRLLLRRLFPAWDVEGTVSFAFGAGGALAVACAIFGGIIGFRLDAEERRNKRRKEGAQDSAKAADAPSALFMLLFRLRCVRLWAIYNALFLIYQGGPALLVWSAVCFSLGFLTDVFPFFLTATLLAAGFVWTMLYALMRHIGDVAVAYAEKNIKGEKVRKFIVLECICGSYLGGGSVYFFVAFWPAFCVYVTNPYVQAVDGGWGYYALSFFLCLFVYCHRPSRVLARSESTAKSMKILKSLKFNILSGIILYWSFVFVPNGISNMYGWIF